MKKTKAIGKLDLRLVKLQQSSVTGGRDTDLCAKASEVECDRSLKCAASLGPTKDCL